MKNIPVFWMLMAPFPGGPFLVEIVQLPFPAFLYQRRHSPPLACVRVKQCDQIKIAKCL